MCYHRYLVVGKEQHRELIDQSGEGSIEVSLQGLATGIYLYSLVIDGKLIDTKRMLID
ncbi:MAG: hypothetical protein AAFU64_17255 [Bacteroidota bacterium]